ncbi:MAG: hypothetical protein ABEJ28_10670 [Salinigranum sp.]
MNEGGTIGRRRFVEAGVTGLALFAGCMGTPAADVGESGVDGQSTAGGKSAADRVGTADGGWAGGGSAERPPEAARQVVGGADLPAATFESGGKGRTTYRLSDLPTSPSSAPPASNGAFSLSVRPGTVELTAPAASVNRPIELHLRIEDAAGDEHAFTAVQGPEANGMAVRFDVGDLALAREVGRRAAVYARDTARPGRTHLLKTQHYLGVPYHLSDGTNGTHWVSADSLNGPVRRTSGCAHEVLERGGDYVVITAQRFRGKTFGASVTFPRGFYRRRYDERFRRKGKRRVSSVEYAARREDPHLNRYARDLSAVIERAGFTDPQEKVLAAARTVQTLRYKWGHNPSGGKTIQFPPQLLINDYGVCSGRTVLLAYLFATDAFGNLTTAYGDCRMRGVRHWAPGIDVRGFGYEPGEQPDEWYTFAPSEKQGFEDTEFVFLESIAVRDLGEFNPSVYTKPHVWDTVDLKYHDSCC